MKPERNRTGKKMKQIATEFLFHSYLIYISCLPSYCFFAFPALSHSYFIPINFYFIASPALFHSYFIPTQLLSHSDFISVSFLFHSYLCTISLSSQLYFIFTSWLLFHCLPSCISFLFHSYLATISLSSQLYFTPISFLPGYYVIVFPTLFHSCFIPISFLFFATK